MLNELLCNKKTYIYGTGDKARTLSDLLINNGIIPMGYIVSDGYAKTHYINGKKVVELSDFFEESDYIILIAVNGSKNKHDIICNINKAGLRYYCVCDEEIRGLYRKAHPINPQKFLETTSPVSRVFGLDRGDSIARLYIETFLEREVKELSKDQNIISTLEVGEDKYIQRFFPDSERSILDYSLGVDLTKPDSLGKKKYDVFICTNVLNFIFDYKAAIKGCYEVLKDEGVLLATVAGNISQISRYDMDRWGDYWRFTYLSVERLFKEVFGEDVRIVTYGNSVAATAFIQGVSVQDLPNKSLLFDVVDPDYSIVIGVVGKKHIPKR